MPVPLTTSGFALAAILLPISETASLIIAIAAMVNQVIIDVAVMASADAG